MALGPDTPGRRGGKRSGNEGRGDVKRGERRGMEYDRPGTAPQRARSGAESARGRREQEAFRRRQEARAEKQQRRRGSMASELAEYPPTGPQGHYECDVCHAVYPSYEAAAACEARHATGSGGGYFECDICGQAYPDFDQAAACEERHARDPRRRGRAVKPGGRQQQATGRRSRERGTN